MTEERSAFIRQFEVKATFEGRPVILVLEHHVLGGLIGGEFSLREIRELDPDDDTDPD